MKNTITKLLNLLMLLLSINMFSQNNLIKKTGKATEASFTYQRPNNCALNTSLFMMDIKQNKDANYLKEKYSLTEINSELFVSAFIKVGTNFDKSKTELLGICKVS